MSPAVSEWEVGGDDYAIKDVGVPASVPVPPLLISGLVSPSGLPAPSLVTPAEWDVGMELCVSPLEQMDVTSEQSKQAGQSSTLDPLSSDPPESSLPVSFAVWGLVSAGTPSLVTGPFSQTLQAGVDILSPDSSSMPVGMTSCLPVEEAVIPCASTGVEQLTPPVDVRFVERKSSPFWEDLGASLAQLLRQHEKAGPTPYSDEIKQKADNYQRLLAQYKCRPFLEETATTSVPASDVAPATTTSTTLSVTAQPLPPVMTFTEPESVTPAPASSSIESVTPVPASSSPELVTPPSASSGPELVTPPPASSGPESVTPPPASSGPESVTPPPASSGPESVTPPPVSSGPESVTPPPAFSSPQSVTPHLLAPMHCPHLSLVREPLSMSLELLSGPRILLVPLHFAGHLFCLSWKLLNTPWTYPPGRGRLANLHLRS